MCGVHRFLTSQQHLCTFNALSCILILIHGLTTGCQHTAKAFQAPKLSENSLASPTSYISLLPNVRLPIKLFTVTDALSFPLSLPGSCQAHDVASRRKSGEAFSRTHVKHCCKRSAVDLMARSSVHRLLLRAQSQSLADGCETDPSRPQAARSSFFTAIAEAWWVAS